MIRAIRIVVYREWREMRRDARLVLAVTLGFLLVAAACVGGLRQYYDVAREKAMAADVERARWLSLDASRPHDAAHQGLYVFKPQSILTAFDPGTEPFLGVSVWLEAHKQNPFVYRPMQDAAPMQRFSSLTPATAFQLLGPLIIILLGFGAFVAEREQGTLRQLLGTGVDGRAILLGKAVAVCGAVLVALLPAVAVAVVGSTSAGFEVPRLRVVFLGAAYLLYLGAFLGMTLAISTRAASPRSALVILLTIWVANGFLLPRAVAEVTERIAPLPSATEWRAAMEAEMRDGHPAGAEPAIKHELLRDYGVDTEDTLPVNWRGVVLQRGEEQNYPVFDAHFGRLFDAIRRQDETFQWGGIVAPVLAVQSLSMGLAGSDFEHHRQFVRVAEDHRRLMLKTINDDLTLHPEKAWGEYKAGPELWARVPKFVYAVPDWRDLSRHYMSAAAILACWFLIAWGFALGAPALSRP